MASEASIMASYPTPQFNHDADYLAYYLSGETPISTQIHDTHILSDYGIGASYFGVCVPFFIQVVLYRDGVRHFNFTLSPNGDIFYSISFDASGNKTIYVAKERMEASRPKPLNKNRARDIINASILPNRIYHDNGDHYEFVYSPSLNAKHFLSRYSQSFKLNDGVSSVAELVYIGKGASYHRKVVVGQNGVVEIVLADDMFCAKFADGRILPIYDIPQALIPYRVYNKGIWY